MLDDWNQSIHNLELLAYKNNFCYLPANASINLKMDIIASFVKDFARYSSVDYVLKKYVSEKEFQNSVNPYVILLSEIKDTIWEAASDLAKRRKRLSLIKETEITLGLISSFMRLDNSFESSLFLITSRFYFESMAINRLIFEQLNYCFKLSQISPSEFKSSSINQIENLLNPTNIGKLKEFYKKAELGKIYSALSTNAHIGIKGANEFISYDQESKEHVVTLKSVIQSIQSAIYLLYITDLYGLVFEYCFFDKSNIELKFNQLNNCVLKPEKNRKIIVKYSEFIDRFGRLLEEVEIPIKFKSEFESHIANEDLPF